MTFTYIEKKRKHTWNSNKHARILHINLHYIVAILGESMRTWEELKMTVLYDCLIGIISLYQIMLSPDSHVMLRELGRSKCWQLNFTTNSQDKT